jgi:hypothetical protein
MTTVTDRQDAGEGVRRTGGSVHGGEALASDGNRPPREVVARRASPIKQPCAGTLPLLP